MKKVSTSLLVSLLTLFSLTQIQAQDYISAGYFTDTSCAPTNVQFNNSSSIISTASPIEFRWYLDGNQFIVDTLPDTVMYAGNYSLRLEAYDTNNVMVGDPYEDSVYIYGNPGKFYPEEGSEFCPNEEVHFSYKGPWENISWDFGDGGNAEGSSHVGYTYSTEGTYEVKVNVSYGACSFEISQNIVISNTALPSFHPKIVDSGPFCPNDEVQFDIGMGQFEYIDWIMPNNDILYGHQVNYVFGQTDDQFVVARVQNECGNWATDTLRVVLENNVQSSAFFSYKFKGDPCPENRVDFSTSSTGTKQWDFGDGATSTKMNPSHHYADTGDYPVKLTITNSCGNVSVFTDTIRVVLDGVDNIYPQIEFQIEDDNGNSGQMIDTLKICPFESFSAFFTNTTGNSNYKNIVKNFWDFGDGNIIDNQDQITHQYNAAGLYQVKFTQYSNCGEEAPDSLVVFVDGSILPDAQDIQAAPVSICPGEEVLFKDQKNGIENGLKYVFDFGDSSPVTDTLDTYVDLASEVIAKHKYTFADTFNYTVDVINKCSNTSTYNGAVIVTTDNGHPFYFVENSTEDRDNYETQDWTSLTNDGNTHQFIIDVQIENAEYSPTSDQYSIFFWYGSDPDEDQKRPPDGRYDFMETFTNMQAGRNVTAYVPVDVTKPRQVSIKVEWYCEESQILKKSPDVMGIPFGDNVFNIEQGGTSNVQGITGQSVIMDGSAYDNICGPLMPSGTYRAPKDAATDYILKFTFESEDNEDKDGNGQIADEYQLFEVDKSVMDIHKANIPPFDHGNYSVISGNNLNMFSNTTCGSAVQYSMMNDFDSIVFSHQGGEMCPDKLAALDGKKYFRDNQNMSSSAACVGDNVQFVVVGGISYTWDFGDGSPRLIDTTAGIVAHSYSNEGVYDAWVAIENACGRSDTVYTQVTIANGNVPMNSFNIESNNPKVGDPVQFTYNGHDPNGDFTYHWDFGDGNTSTAQNPTHVFNAPGNFNVSLDVTNGCGASGPQSMNIYIEDNQIICDVDARFTFDIQGDSVSFHNNSAGHFTDVYWEYGDGATSNAVEEGHNYLGGGAYLVKLSLIDTLTGCTSNATQEIHVGTIDCLADFVFNVNTFNTDITLSDLSSSGTRVTWNMGDNTVYTESVVNHTYPTPGRYPVCLTVFNDVNGCTDKKCIEIEVGAIDSTECFPEFTHFADSLTVFFTNESQGDSLIYFWDFGDNVQSNDTNPSHVFMAPGVYDITLTIGSTDGTCQKTMHRPIQVGSLDCIASFDFFSDPTLDQVTFNNTSIGAFNRINWEFGDGTVTHDVPNPEHTFPGPGVYYVCLKVFDDTQGCFSEHCEEIVVGFIDNNNFCKPEFNFYIEGDSVVFNNVSEGGFTNAQWDLGDGYTTEEFDLTHVYDHPGRYQVCLNIFDTVTGCQNVLCQEVVIGTFDCFAEFDFYVRDSIVDLVDISTGVFNKWHWTLGDGSYSTSQNDTKVYQDGIYEICLAVLDTVGGCASEICKEVAVFSEQDTIILLDADFSFFIDEASKEVAFSDLSTGNISNRYWTMGDGSFIQDSVQFVHAYNEGGAFEVCLNLFDDQTGQTSQICKMIHISRACAITANFSKFIDVTNKEVNFIDKSTGGGNSWYWTFGNGKTSAATAPIHKYDEAGYYLVTLSVHDTVTGCADHTSDFIEIGDLDCRADFDFLVNAETNSVEFTNLSKGDVSKVFWSFDDGTNSEEFSPSHSYDRPGLYHVSLVVATMNKECRDEIIMPVQVGQVDCDAEFAYYVDSLTNTVYFTNEALGNTTENLWIFGDGAVSEQENPVHQYIAPGYFTVELNTYDPITQCMDVSREVILIGEQGQDCEADFYFQVDSLTVQFFDNSSGDNLTYNWFFGEGDAKSTDQNPEHTYLVSDYKFVCLTVENASGIKNTTCKDVRVVVEDEQDCFADFIYVVDSISNEVTFIDRSLGDPKQWLWKFGNANEDTSRAQNPTFTYDAPGYYNVRLVSGDTSRNCLSRSWDIVNVQVNLNDLRAGFGYEVDTLSLNKSGGYPVDFVGVASGTPGSFAWDFGDGGTFEDASSLTYVYDSAGIYYVCLAVYDPITEFGDTICEEVVVGDITTDGPIMVLPAFEQVTLNTFPNPFVDVLNIQYEIPSDMNVKINLYENNGRLIQTLVNTSKLAGDYTIQIDGANMTQGIYYVQMITENQIQHTKVLIKQ